jgi:hypothetical protein
MFHVCMDVTDYPLYTPLPPSIPHHRVSMRHHIVIVVYLATYYARQITSWALQSDRVVSRIYSTHNALYIIDQTSQCAAQIKSLCN